MATATDLRARAEALAADIAALPRGEQFEALNVVRAALHAVSPNAAEPVDLVRWIPIEQVQPNSYNPNKVAQMEMKLLLRSINHDGYTQPIVAIRDAARGVFEVVDGFHRYFCGRENADLRARVHGYLPVVVLDKDINDRMAATIRHNRARGKHSVDGMASMVFSMLDNGMDDVAVCAELGMEAEELLRLKHITGFSKLFKDTAYHRAWVVKNQIRIRRAHDARAAASEASVEPVPTATDGDE